jgi:amino acid permease
MIRIENHRIKFSCCSLILATQIFNMLHNMVGVGTLAYPSTFKNAGIIPGTIITVISGIMVYYSAELIILNMLRVKKWTFLGISKEIYHPIISKIIELLKSITTFLSSTAFAITALDSLPCLTLSIENGGEEIINGRLLNAFIIFIFLCFVVLYEDINSLSIISFIGLFVFIGTVFTLNGYIIMYSFPKNKYEVLTEPNWDWMLAISTNCLAFAIHYNATRYYYEVAREELKKILREKENKTSTETNVLITLDNNDLNDVDYMEAMSRLNSEVHEQSKKIMKDSLVVTFIIASIIYLVFGISGYIKLGDNVKGDMLLSIKVGTTFINVLRLLIAISVITAIPLTIHPAVDGLMNIIKECECRCNIYGNNRDGNNYNLMANNQNENNPNKNNTNENNPNKNNNFIINNYKIIRKLIAIIMTFGVMYTAAIIEDLKELLTLKGSTLIVMFVLLIPSIDRLRIIYLFDNENKEYLGRSILILILGISIMICGVYEWYRKYIEEDDSHIIHKNYTNITSKDCPIGIWEYYFNKN